MALLHGERESELEGIVSFSPARYLATNFPKVLELSDHRGRTCLHYSALAKDPSQCLRMLANAGADRDVKDKVIVRS